MYAEANEAVVDRKDTAIRILITLLFFLIIRVIEIALAVVIVFELAYSLITGEDPGVRVKKFANNAISYLYRILRYLTYNEPDPPFPFADFPQEMHP